MEIYQKRNISTDNNIIGTDGTLRPLYINGALMPYISTNDFKLSSDIVTAHTFLVRKHHFLIIEDNRC